MPATVSSPRDLEEIGLEQNASLLRANLDDGSAARSGLEQVQAELLAAAREHSATIG